MTIQINPIQYGEEQATSVILKWAENDFGSETPEIKAELISGTTKNCLDRRQVTINKSEYLAAANKDDFILEKFNLVKNINNPI